MSNRERGEMHIWGLGLKTLKKCTYEYLYSIVFMPSPIHVTVFNSLLGSCLVLSDLYIYLYGKAKEPQAKTTMSGSMDKELQVWPTRGSTSEDTASGP